MVFFHSSTLAPMCYQTQKPEFIGEGRTMRNPQCLDGDWRSGQNATTSEAVASLSVEMQIPIEGEAQFSFCFGVSRSVERALDTVRKLSDNRATDMAIEASRLRWKELCSLVQVDSEDPAFNALVNTWLPYEAYSSWIGRRTGGVCLDPTQAADALRRFYALSATAQQPCRDSLLSFAAGISCTGTFSPDDESFIMLPLTELLWLPVCTVKYIAETGDMDVLLREIPLKDGPTLTLKEHCERIINACINQQQPSGDPGCDRLLEQTIGFWSLISEDAGELYAYLDGAASRALPE